MKEKVERAIHGFECPKCGSDHLYRLKDERFKCGQCGYKYSPKRLKDDLEILHYFSLEIPANKTAKDLEFSYVKVRNKYM
jgi:ribosomal protein S27AE